MIQQIIDAISNFISSLLDGSIFFQAGVGIWNWLIDFAYSIISSDPRNLADGNLWAVADSIFQTMEIVGASLMTVLFLINFVKETSDIRQSMTLESCFVMILKLVVADVVMLNLSTLVELVVGMEQDMISIVAPAGSNSLHISLSGAGGWNIGSAFGPAGGWIFGLLFTLIALGAGIIIIWKCYAVLLKIYFYLAVAPLAMSTILGTKGMSQSAYSWIRTFLCALSELAGIVLILHLGAVLISSGGYFPTPGNDIIGSFGGTPFWEALQCTVSVVLLTGSVSAVDSMIRRGFGF